MSERIKIKNHEGKEIEVNVDDFDIEMFDEVSLALCDFVKGIDIHCNDDLEDCSEYCKKRNLHNVVTLSEIYKIYKKLKEKKDV